MPAAAYKTKALPPNNMDWGRLMPVVEEANAAISEYKGAVEAIPRPDVLLEPLSYAEAVASSHIEGIHSSLLEVLEYRAIGAIDESTSKQIDNLEVLNCHTALREAAALMDTLPLSERVLKSAHENLMQSVRGRNKEPGQYRRIQNWIGGPGSTIEQASYIPCHTAQLGKAMGSWSQYINSDDEEALIQLAIMHVEFEAIHPFLDGNGRVGRLLIPLFFLAKDILPGPYFYMAESLERHRSDYYQGLRAVSANDDWTGWCRFFLQAAVEQTQANLAKINKLADLYRNRKDWMMNTASSKHGVRALEWMFLNPVFVAADFIGNSGIPRSTARRILVILQREKMLATRKAASGKRSAILVFSDLVNICAGKDVA